MKGVFVFLSIFVAVTIASAGPVVVLVRHAEKAASGGNDPGYLRLAVRWRTRLHGF
jgi:hypothetical protein